MKNLIILVCFLTIWTCPIKAQTCTQTGASINTGALITKNIKTDFGAIGDGVADDHQAFKNAAACINNRGGNVKLIIPDGIYLVGKQTSSVGIANYWVPVYEGERVMLLSDVENVVIEGQGYAHIRYKDGLKFGTFDTTTGLPPVRLDLYNPADTIDSLNRGSYYRYAGTVGNFLEIVQGNNIRVTNLEIDGNSDNYFLGGNWGIGERPIELSNCYGILLSSVKNSDFSNLRIHHFGVDNLYVNSLFTGKSLPIPESTNLIFDSIKCEYSGRTNFSWAGGENICVLNSAFNHAANKEIRTKPGYGFNIEPEGDTTFAGVSCTNGFFYNNVYGFNRGLALTAGTSRDNPVHGFGFGYSYDHYFKKCILVGKNESATHNAINRVTFDSCAFYGQVLSRGSSIDATDPAVFKNSYFSDCYNGEPMFNQPLLSFDFGYKCEILNSVFKKFIPPAIAGNNFIFDYNISSYPCSTDTYKPLIEDCSFWYYPAPMVGVPQYASNARQTLFKNNSFYKAESDQVRWGYLTGCPHDPLTPYGEGNVNLGGNGFQRYDTVTYDIACSTQLVCEPSIYLSEALTDAKAFRSLSTFFADETISLSSETVTADAQDYIQLNPGFESDLAGTASIELQIETCAYGSGLLRQNRPPVKSNIPSTDIPSVAMFEDVLVFPNPSSEDFKILIRNDQNSRYTVSYELYNATNNLVQRGMADCPEKQCNKIVIRKIKSAGIYYLKLYYNNSIVVKKLVKL